HDAFGALEKDVAGEAVDDDDVDFTRGHVLALDVADVVDRQAADQRDGFAERRVALALLFTVGQGGNRRTWSTKRQLGIQAAHQRELGQPFRFYVDVGTRVEQDAHAFEGWQLRSQRRALGGDALDASQTEQGTGEHAASVAGGDEA